MRSVSASAMRGFRRLLRRCDQARGSLPQRLAVGAPVERERPARQLLAGIPFALAVVQQAARREALLQAADQVLGIAPLGRADGGGVPLGAFHVVGGDERRLAAHAEAHVAALSAARRPRAGGDDRLPRLLAVGLGDARRLQDARRRASRSRTSTSAGSCAPVIGAALDGMRRRGQRNVALRRRAARRSGRGRSSPRRADTPRPRRAGR